MIVLQLPLGERSVPVCFARAGCRWVAGEIASRLSSLRPRLFLLTDERIALHYQSELTGALEEQGLEVIGEIIPPGEIQKSLHRAECILDRLVLERFARDELVIAFGGGVVCDLAGFAASIYQRGMKWIAIPTTLLAMVDAAIGGKTGVDHILGKNLIGTFHQPLAVLAPFETLRSLDRREWRAGSAEVVKAGLLTGGELWSLILEYGPDLRAWPETMAFDCLPKAARVKIEIVAQDERESGIRRFLNLGHTLGHALESATGYSVFKHGEAVFLGLRAALRLSERCAGLDSRTAQEGENLLSRAWFPRADVSAADLQEGITRDKKKSGGRLQWVLLKEIGKPVITSDVPDSLIQETCDWLSGLVAEGGRAPEEIRRLRILVLNGPNLNLLGEREPEIYGHTRYEELEASLRQLATEKNAELMVRQNNVEGELVSLLQQARHWADGIVINPGGYTHTSVALRDAIAALHLPVLEVHLSDITQREEFRRHSLIAGVCQGHVYGQGIKGYQEAVGQLLDRLSHQRNSTSGFNRG